MLRNLPDLPSLLPLKNLLVASSGLVCGSTNNARWKPGPRPAYARRGRPPRVRYLGCQTRSESIYRRPTGPDDTNGWTAIRFSAESPRRPHGVSSRRVTADRARNGDHHTVPKMMASIPAFTGNDSQHSGLNRKSNRGAFQTNSQSAGKPAALGAGEWGAYLALFEAFL